MKPQDVVVGMEVVMTSDVGSVGTVLKRDGQKVRVDFGDKTQWKAAAELEPKDGAAAAPAPASSPAPAPASSPAPALSPAPANDTSEDNPEAVQAMMDLAKNEIILATLNAHGGSCTFQEIMGVAEEKHCDVASAALLSLKRDKKLSYDGMMLLLPPHADVVITLVGKETADAATASPEPAPEPAAAEQPADDVRSSERADYEAMDLAGLEEMVNDLGKDSLKIEAAKALSDDAQTKAALVDLLLAEAAPASLPAEEGVPPAAGGQAGKVILLMTGMPSTQAIELSQRKCLDILKAKGLTVEEIDGTLEDCKEKRGELFKISGKSAVYPQIFIELEEGGAGPKFVGDWEEFEGLIECETLDPQMLTANPDIMTFSKAFAELL